MANKYTLALSLLALMAGLAPAAAAQMVPAPVIGVGLAAYGGVAGALVLVRYFKGY